MPFVDAQSGICLFNLLPGSHNLHISPPPPAMHFVRIWIWPKIMVSLSSTQKPNQIQIQNVAANCSVRYGPIQQRTTRALFPLALNPKRILNMMQFSRCFSILQASYGETRNEFIKVYNCFCVDEQCRVMYDINIYVYIYIFSVGYAKRWMGWVFVFVLDELCDIWPNCMYFKRINIYIYIHRLTMFLEFKMFIVNCILIHKLKSGRSSILFLSSIFIGISFATIG